MDGFDRRLLELLQTDALQTAEQLAARVGLSPSAVQRRTRALRDSGAIAATVAVVSPAAVGRPTFFLVGLEVERERSELLTRLRAWMADEAAVQQAFYVTGPWDFILVIVARDVGEYDELMSRLMSENPNVKRFTTNVALGVHKQGLALPIG